MGQTSTGRRAITKRVVDALKPGEAVFDDRVRGFGVRRRGGEARSYFIKVLTETGRQRWITIGTHGSPWTADTARTEALRLLGEVKVEGKDPVAAKIAAKQAMTVAELCDLYLSAADEGRLITRHKRIKKASTLATDRGRIERHIKPLLGAKAVRDLTTTDLGGEGFMGAVTVGKTKAKVKTRARGVARVTGGRGTATRTLGLLGAILDFAVKQGIRPDNPARGIARPKDGVRQRILSPEDYRALGMALDAAAAGDGNPTAAVQLRLIALTGMRRGEVVKLRRTEIDLKARCLRLGDTKTGASLRPLGAAAAALLEAQPVTAGSPYVFPGSAPQRPYSGLPKASIALFAKAGLPTGGDDPVTLHTLRHALATVAHELGYSESTIAALLGHRLGGVTAKYIHAPDAVLLAAADRVAREIDARMRGTADRTGTVFELASRRA